MTEIFMAYEGSSRRLIKVVQDLSSVKTLEDVMFFVRTAARDIAKADGATFVLKDRDFCFYADEDAMSPLWKGQRFPLNACISGWSMLNKQAVIIEDIYLDPRIPHDAYRPTFVKSLVMTPIRKHDPIGAIGTYWKDQTTPTSEQLEMLQALADTASVVMENVTLYTSLQNRIDELKMANNAKDEFLMTLSHELRTPLTAILGWSEILTDPGISADDYVMGLKTVHQSAKTQAHIIEDLLDVSQITSGKFHVNYDPVDFLAVTKDVVTAFLVEAQQKKITLQLNNHLSTANVLGDSDRLRQVLSNLIGNALKFSNPESEVLITINRLGPNVEIKVKDSGIGISEDFIPHVFDRFKQADSTLTRKYGGLGLGLAIVYHLIEAHRGNISVQSEGPGKGAEFTFQIPLLDPISEELMPA
jgi:signal transduction histidine kinase